MTPAKASFVKLNLLISILPEDVSGRSRRQAQPAGARLSERRIEAKQIPAPRFCQYINQNELLLTGIYLKAMVEEAGRQSKTRQ
jgi:hypothetical protein